MKQVLQNLRDGRTDVADVPCPAVQPGRLLIRSSHSLVSVGTERMLVEFGKANLLDKARQQPDKVRQVLDKVQTDGLAPTLDAVRSKLDQPLALGYCNVGSVIEVGPGVDGFATGDRVASNGGHAEIVSVPGNLCARVPEGVGDEEAAFTVIGAIALQGIRLAQPSLGETIVVTGLGLVGLMTVQLLRSHGCRVLGIDFDPARLALAKRFGAEVVDLSAGGDPLAAAEALSRGRGVDAVIITASSKSNEPVSQAAHMCRKRGRIILVGVTGLELSRADFYEKELTFQVSCSYGPGRYDPNYEDKGQDYPVGFVRWTEQRNFEAVLDMMADGRLDVKPLITHRFAISDAQQAYALMGGAEDSLGILLTYPMDAEEDPAEKKTIALGNVAAVDGAPALAFVGSGNYATRILIPAFKAGGATLKTVASSGGVSSLHAARKFGVAEATTDVESILHDPGIDAIVIATRHDSHAEFTARALRQGRHVFVEKPLCLTLDELAMIEEAHRDRTGGDAAPLLMVGFNRRFAPLIQNVKAHLAGLDTPKSFVMTVNAGALPQDHWTRDRSVGGGRIIGEACHFIDLLRHLAGCSITGYACHALAGTTDDTASLQLSFSDGSIGTIHYFANGNRRFPKERLEVFAAGRVLQLDNFRRLSGFGWPGFRRKSLWRQDKGQHACAAAFIDALKTGGPAPIAFGEICEVSRISIELARA